MAGAPYDDWETKERMKRGHGSNIPFKGRPHVIRRLPTGPHLLKVPLLPSRAMGWRPIFKTQAFG